MKPILALLLFVSCASTAIGKHSININITFPDGSEDGEVWACRRFTLESLHCVDLIRFLHDHSVKEKADKEAKKAPAAEAPL